MISLPTISLPPAIPCAQTRQTWLAKMRLGSFPSKHKSVERIPGLQSPAARPSPVLWDPAFLPTGFRALWTRRVSALLPGPSPALCVCGSPVSPFRAPLPPLTLRGHPPSPTPLLECPGPVCSVFANRRKSDRSSYTLFVPFTNV